MKSLASMHCVNKSRMHDQLLMQTQDSSLVHNHGSETFIVTQTIFMKIEQVWVSKHTHARTHWKTLFSDIKCWIIYLFRNYVCHFSEIEIIRLDISCKSSAEHSLTLRKHAYWNILKILPPKSESFQIKKFWCFPYFCSKHRLWVLVRTASPGTHNLCFWAE